MNLTELIKALKRLKVETGSLACMGCGLEHNCGIHGCAIIREAIKALETPPWIPVAEDEPPTGTTLLLSVWDPDDRRLYTTAGWKGAQWHHIFNVPLMSTTDPMTITHWMPMPEPPEVSEDD